MDVSAVYSIVLVSIMAASCNLSRGGGTVDVTTDPSSDTSTTTESTDTNDRSSEPVSVISTESETGSGDGCITGETDSLFDTNIGSDTNTNTTISVDTDTGIDTGAGIVDTGTGMDTNTATDTSNGIDTSMGVDTSTDSETNALSCPEDMALVSGLSMAAFCIDKYEASRPDATVNSVGVDDTQAMSVAYVLPWNLNPMSDTVLVSLKTVCQNVGKSLCTDEQWAASCEGLSQTAFVYGDVFDVEACNNVATFCDDYCDDNQFDPGQCNTNTSNCGASMPFSIA